MKREVNAHMYANVCIPTVHIVVIQGALGVQRVYVGGRDRDCIAVGNQGKCSKAIFTEV